MSGIKETLKDGWHPKGKEGGKESWRGDFKGINQVAGWVGKGKSNDDASSGPTRSSRPLNSLKDPSTFGAPPRRGTSGSQGLSDRGQTHPSSTSDHSHDQSHVHEEPQAETSGKPPPPPVPYRADRTGLATNHLPKPPGRHTDQSTDDHAAATKPNSKPPVPPRLPPRKPSNSTLSDSSPAPPPYDTAVRDPPSHPPARNHQGAISRLGNAGVSVPGLGIGKNTNQDNDASQSGSPSTQNSSSRNQLSELQGRFSKMSSSSPDHSAAATPTEGTTTAQKKDALRTASSFHQDPSSVSSTDARNAASTANNFRERHGDQVAAGKKKLSGINEKYGISKRINSFIEDQSSPADQPSSSSEGNRRPPPVPPPHPTSTNQAATNNSAPLNNRKPPPPPPPPKKRELQSAPVGGEQAVAPPPPLPLGTKPRPGG